MPERVIVTIRYGDREGDFDVPSKAAIGMIEEALRDVAKLQFPELMLQGRQIFLRDGNGRLDSSRTFEEYGIFDGAVLTLEIAYTRST